VAAWKLNRIIMEKDSKAVVNALHAVIERYDAVLLSRSSINGSSKVGTSRRTEAVNHGLFVRGYQSYLEIDITVEKVFSKLRPDTTIKNGNGVSP
jgi:hypothetical protein